VEAAESRRLEIAALDVAVVVQIFAAEVFPGDSDVGKSCVRGRLHL
jgi:hypothetical protein